MEGLHRLLRRTGDLVVPVTENFHGKRDAILQYQTRWQITHVIAEYHPHYQ